MDLSIPSMTLSSTPEGLYADLVSVGYPKDGKEIQKQISLVADEFMGNGPISSKMGVRHLVMGVNEMDYIDTLAKVSISLDIDPIAQPFKKQLLDMIEECMAAISGDTLPLPMRFEEIHLGIERDNVLQSNIKASVAGFDGVTLNIPYVTMQIEMDGVKAAIPLVDGLTFKNGEFNSKILVNMLENPELHQEITHLFSSLIFRRPIPKKVSVGVTGFSFGKDVSSAIQMASKANLKLDPIVVLEQISAWIKDDATTPIFLENIYTEMNNKGMDTVFYSRALPSWLPLTTHFGGVYAQVMYNTDRQYHQPSQVIADCYFYDLKILPGQKVNSKLIIRPRQDQLLGPLKLAVIRLLSWEDYAEDSYLGAVTVTQGDPRPQVFMDGGRADLPGIARERCLETETSCRGTGLGNIIDVAKKTFFRSPGKFPYSKTFLHCSFVQTIFSNFFHYQDLYFWDPVQVFVEKIRPKLSSLWGGALLEFDVRLGWPNYGPLQLDLGQISMEILGKTVKVQSKGVVTVKNVNHNGHDINNNPENLTLEVNVSGWRMLTSIVDPRNWGKMAGFIGSIFGNFWDIIKDPKNAANHISTDNLIATVVTRPGEGEVTWLNEALSLLPKTFNGNVGYISEASSVHTNVTWGVVSLEDEKKIPKFKGMDGGVTDENKTMEIFRVQNGKEKIEVDDGKKAIEIDNKKDGTGEFEENELASKHVDT